jgi:hypothetical protein
MVGRSIKVRQVFVELRPEMGAEMHAGELLRMDAALVDAAHPIEGGRSCVCDSRQNPLKSLMYDSTRWQTDVSPVRIATHFTRLSVVMMSPYWQASVVVVAYPLV